MNQTRSATSRAKPISWVTHIIVMPSAGQAAHDRQDLAHHLGIERAGRLVEQHRGRLHGERACDRHALLLAAGKLRRISVALAARPTRSSSAWLCLARHVAASRRSP